MFFLNFLQKHYVGFGVFSKWGLIDMLLGKHFRVPQEHVDEYEKLKFLRTFGILFLAVLAENDHFRNFLTHKLLSRMREIYGGQMKFRHNIRTVSIRTVILYLYICIIIFKYFWCVESFLS